MKPGRELDKLVAEKVMNLIGDYRMCGYCGSEMRYCGDRSRCTQCGEWRYGPYKEYSEDIAAAWEVVEKMQEKHSFSLNSKRGWAHASFMGGDLGKVVMAQGDSVPHAICLAALKAVEN